MAEKEQKALTADQKFRREAALVILGAYVAKHGGFPEESREAHVRVIWEYADVFLALENAAPPQPESPAEPEAARRRWSPADEFAVWDGDKKHRGFVTVEEAEAFAAKRPGAKVVQVSGAGAPAAPVTV